MLQLLDVKVDIDQTMYNMNTLLTLAAQCEYESIVELLLKAGANTGARNKDGEDALDGALVSNNPTLIQLLKNSPSNGKGSKYHTRPPTGGPHRATETEAEKLISDDTAQQTLSEHAPAALLGTRLNVETPVKAFGSLIADFKIGPENEDRLRAYRYLNFRNLVGETRP